MLFYLLGSACDPSPSKLLTEESMVAVLADLEVARAIAEHYATDKDTALWLLEKNTLSICKAHNIDLATFQMSYQYYLNNIEVLRDIHGRVVKHLGMLKDAYG